MYRVEPLPHTADVGYEVTADSLEELFRGAADGLGRTLRADSGEAGNREEMPRILSPSADRRGEAPEGEARTERLSLERPDRERLLVSWLRELLHRITTRGRFPAAIEVKVVGPAALRARVEWEPEARPEELAREVKGVTYHGLAVERGNGGEWHARLVLDV